jgi:putative SOS response-associated peptidase YedK
MPGVFPDYHPVARNTDTGREMAMMRWGMLPPPRAGNFPVTNIRNTSSPHWRAWLKPENRRLVPADSSAEYATESGKKDVVWFALLLTNCLLPEQQSWKSSKYFQRWWGT